MAEWRIDLARIACRQLAAADPEMRKRLEACINRLPAGDVKKLRGPGNRFRARVGNWRVIFQIDRKRRTIAVAGVFPRDKAY